MNKMEEKSRFNENQTPAEIADIVSDALMDNVRQQFKVIEMAIQEKRKDDMLIAKFMNVKCRYVDTTHLNVTPFWLIADESKPKGYVSPSTIFFSEEHCLTYFVNTSEYSTNWNWLMEVVEKIGQIPGGDGYEFKRSLDGGLFIGIEKVYERVVDFIKHGTNTR